MAPHAVATVTTKDGESETAAGGTKKGAAIASATTTTTTTEPIHTTNSGPFARFRRRTPNSQNGKQEAGAASASSSGRRRSLSAPLPRRRARKGLSRRRLLMEDHYNVETLDNDNKKPIVLPGVPHHDPDWARDSHDFFNLIVLIPVVALNVMNWNWDYFLKLMAGTEDGRVKDAWTGEWFQVFFFTTLAYFLVDLVWIMVVPSCVKSPATIYQHHVATILYIMIPYYIADFQWCMGACMSVEINTWFLIARRVFNKQGFPPWIIDLSFFSIRVKLISVFFYVTWIAIRCIVYPWLMPGFVTQYIEYSEKIDTYWNLLALSIPLHAAFCLLNFKWTYDLFSSKLRFWTRKNKSGQEPIDKGL